jgi:hypothetical protein
MIYAALREVVRKTASIAQVAQALTEASYGKVSTGQKVYILSGPGAGYRGTLKEINHGYAKVEGENFGNFWFVPAVFLTPDTGSV